LFAIYPLQLREVLLGSWFYGTKIVVYHPLRKDLVSHWRAKQKGDMKIFLENSVLGQILGVDSSL
jgi:hypothetical protein